MEPDRATMREIRDVFAQLPQIVAVAKLVQLEIC